MPAVSEPVLPHTWRPLGVRLAGAIFGGALIVVTGFAWFAFDDQTRAAFTTFERATVVVLGALFYAAGYALTRSRVLAESTRLVVVNGYRRHVYEWPEVLAVHLAPGAPWAVLDLADGTSQPAMGIQGSDGARAQRAVAELRLLVDQRPGR